MPSIHSSARAASATFLMCVTFRTAARKRASRFSARSPRSIAVQEEEAEGADLLAQVIRDMAGVESIHAVEGTKTIQTLIVGADITGTGASADRTSTELR